MNARTRSHNTTTRELKRIARMELGGGNSPSFIPDRQRQTSRRGEGAGDSLVGKPAPELIPAFFIKRGDGFELLGPREVVDIHTGANPQLPTDYKT